MNTLGPTERALLVALQEADEPTSDDRDRVRAAVLQRVATASAIAVATWTAASTAGKAGVGLSLAQGGTGLAAGATLTAVEGTGVVAGAAGASAIGGSAIGGSAIGGSAIGGGAAVVGGAAAKVAGAAVFSSAASKVAAAVVGLSLASGATWYAVDHGASKPQTGVVIVEQKGGPMLVQPPVEPARPSAGLASGSAALATERVDEVDLSAKPVRKANRSALRNEAEPQVVDRLAEEAALLKRAQQAINGGNAALALALVEEHAERYPNGVLSQERSGLRAISLCRAGAWQQGVVQAQSFLQRNPVSPLSERVRSVCKLDGN